MAFTLFDASQINGVLKLVGGTLAGILNMGANKITNLANGTASTDAMAFGQYFGGAQSAIQTSGTTTTTFTGATSTMTATVVTGSITPTSSSKRIKVTISFHVQTNNNIGLFAIFRNTTNLMDATGGGQCGSATVASEDNQITLIWIDSPATTSATSYTIYGENATLSGNINVGNGRTWTVILEEIV